MQQIVRNFIVIILIGICAQAVAKPLSSQTACNAYANNACTSTSNCCGSDNGSCICTSSGVCSAACDGP